MFRIRTFNTGFQAGIILFNVMMLSACGKEIDLKLFSMKKVILEEKDGMAINGAEITTIIQKKRILIIANYNHSRIGLWNIEDGTLLKGLKLAIELSDSLYPVKINDEQLSEWAHNRRKVSRHRFDWGNQSRWFDHQTIGLSVNSNERFIDILANIKGTELDYSDSGAAKSLVTALPAIVTYDLEKDKIIAIKRIEPLIDTTLIYSRVWINQTNNMFVVSMVRYPSLKKMLNSSSSDWTMCSFNPIEKENKHFIAKRTYQKNSLFLRGLTSILWLNDSLFLFAHADDKEIFDRSDKPIFQLPHYGEDTIEFDSSRRGPDKNPLLISRHSTIIQNIFKVGEDTIGVFFYSRGTNEQNMIPRVAIYSLARKELLGIATPEKGDSRILYIGAGIDPGALLLIRKIKEDVILETLRIDRHE